MIRLLFATTFVLSMSFFFIGSFEYAHAWSEIALPVRTQYVSPSRQYILRIDPTNQYGRGDAEYWLLKNGQEIWRKKLPFTLYRVSMLDNGSIAGSAYTQGRRGPDGGPSDDHGALVNIIIAPNGRILTQEVFPLSYGDFHILDRPLEPMGYKIFIDLDHDRVVFLNLSNLHFIKPTTTAWHQHELSTGKSLGVFYPEKQMNGTEWLRPCGKAQALPGTPLLLAYWYRREGRPTSKSSSVYGGHFALLDKQLKPIWQLTVRDDYEFAPDEKQRSRLRSWIRDNSAILSTESSGRFDLYFAKKGKRVSFVAKQDKQGKWIVTETGRKDFTPPVLLRPSKKPKKPTTTPTHSDSERE